MNKIIKPTIENQLQLEIRTEEYLQRQSPVYERLMKKVSEITEYFSEDLELARKYTGYECLKKINDPLHIVYNSIVILTQYGKKKEPTYTHACIILGKEMFLKSLEHGINPEDKKMYLQSNYKIYEEVVKIMKENNINIDIKEGVNIEEYFLKIGDIIGQIFEKYEIIKVKQTSLSAPRIYEINEEFANDPLAGKLPMVIVPISRTNSDTFKGGYLKTMVPLVKHHPQIHVDVSNYDCTAINILQNTPFQINPAMLYYMKNKLNDMEKQEKQAKKKGMKLHMEIEKLQYERNQLRFQEELKKEYNKNIFLKAVEKKKWEKKINELEETRYILRYVEVLPEGPFYFPMSIDARGRIYYVPEIINPQASIMARALLDFASIDDALMINNDNYDRCLYNLKLIGASYAGKTRLSEKEKIQWIDKNEDKIMNLEDEFINEIEDAPLFIRFCLEYRVMRTTVVESLKKGEQYLSKMICYIDMSCNAVQHYTALTLKEELAHLVNMKDTDYPMDIYTFVGQEIMKKIHDKEFDEIKQNNELIRKLVKKPIMTYFYGVTDYTIREQIQEVCFKYNIQNYEIIISVLVRHLRAYFNENFQKLSIENYEWISPTKLKIKQDYKVEERKIVRCSYLYNGKNKNQKNFVYYKKTNKSDTRKNKQTILANYVHSMDAAHLNFIVKRYNWHIAVVHDSVGVHLNQIDRTKEIVKETFVEMYTEFHKKNNKEIPEWLEKLKNSKYFIA